MVLSHASEQKKKKKKAVNLHRGPIVYERVAVSIVSQPEAALAPQVLQLLTPPPPLLLLLLLTPCFGRSRPGRCLARDVELDLDREDSQTVEHVCFLGRSAVRPPRRRRHRRAASAHIQI
jgi:hypothetical protein